MILILSEGDVSSVLNMSQGVQIVERFCPVRRAAVIANPILGCYLPRMNYVHSAINTIRWTDSESARTISHPCTTQQSH